MPPDRRPSRKKKSRKDSSTRWLARQHKDPYVKSARAKGYRSRAAFKLEELDEKFNLLKKSARVLDLGAAPGGWSQIAASKVGQAGAVVAIDIQPIEPIPGVTFLEGDATEPAMMPQIEEAIGGSADVVLSDMAAPTTGHRATDHLRTLALLEAALDVAESLLKPGGAFVGKVFQGGATNEVLARIKSRFREVKHVKPPASRSESVELYLVALGFRG